MLCYHACPSSSSTPSPSPATVKSLHLRPKHRVWLLTPPPRSIFTNSNRRGFPARALREDAPEQDQQPTENHRATPQRVQQKTEHERGNDEQERLCDGSDAHAGESEGHPAGKGLIEANLHKPAAARRDVSMSFSQTGDNGKQEGHGSSKVRGDVAPAVLSSLQQGEAKRPPSGSGLIEANLRKRGVAKRFLDLTSDVDKIRGMESSPRASSPIMDGAIMALSEECIDKSAKENRSNKLLFRALASLDAYFDACTKASSDSALSDDALSDSGSMHSIGASSAWNGDHGLASPDSDESLKDGEYVGDNPLKSIFWQEKPMDLSLPPVLPLHGHIDRFRFIFGTCLGDTMSFSSLLWFCWPQLLHFFEHPKWPFAFGVKWAELIKSSTDTEANMKAFQEYVRFWINAFPAEDIVDLITVLTLSVQLQALSGFLTENQDVDRDKELENLSTALRHAELKLHKGVLDPTNVWEKVLQGTSFASDGRVFVYEDALIFSGRLLSQPGDDQLSDDPSHFLGKVQDCLDKDKNLSKRIALLLKSSTTKGHVHLVIAPWYWMVSKNYDAPGLKGLFLVASVLAMGGFESAGFTLSSSGVIWESLALSVGFSAVLASVVFVNNRRLPYFFPFMPIGALGTFTGFPSNLPSRKSFLEALLNSSCVSLATSLLLIAVGSTFWSPSQYDSLHMVDLNGYVLAPRDLLSYSGMLTNLLNSMSVAMVMNDNGDVLQAVSPFTLAGILGLNYTAFTLFPFWSSDGGLLLQNLLGNTKLATSVSLGLSLLMLLPLSLKNPLLGFSLVTYHYVFRAESFAKDGVSEPNLFTKVIGCAFVASSIACLIPLPHT